MNFHDLLSPEELQLNAPAPAPERELSYAAAGLPHRQWVSVARARLAELLALPSLDSRIAQTPAVGTVVRTVTGGDVRTEVIRLDIEPGLSLPGYLLSPVRGADRAERVVLALHGHGEVETLLAVDGVHEDYHHRFAHHLAEAGYTVLVPELRGFGALFDLAHQQDGSVNLRYWRWGTPMTFTLQTDAFLYGRSMLGDTVADLLHWESWLADARHVRGIDVVGISWGGDLACTYPVFSTRVRSIFASGTLGSFAQVFRIGGNAPAHCLPGVLRSFDRADIAGLNAPTPFALHYGALDVPGPDNPSAAYNDSARESVEQLRAIYSAAGATDPVLIVSEGLAHEIDLDALRSWLQSCQG